MVVKKTQFKQLEKRVAILEEELQELKEKYDFLVRTVKEQVDNLNIKRTNEKKIQAFMFGQERRG